MRLDVAALRGWAENVGSSQIGLDQLQLLTCIWGLKVYGGGSSGKSLSRSRDGQPGMAAARMGSRESPQPAGKVSRLKSRHRRP